MVLHYINLYNIKNICIAGGVANNCKMNGAISSLTDIKNCFVVPTSADSGVAYGSALLEAKKHQNKKSIFSERLNVYLGPSYSNNEIEYILKM